MTSGRRNTLVIAVIVAIDGGTMIVNIMEERNVLTPVLKVRKIKRTAAIIGRDIVIMNTPMHAGYKGFNCLHILLNKLQTCMGSPCGYMTIPYRVYVYGKICI